MNYKCQVIVSTEAEQVKKSEMNYKKEWAEIFMNGEIVNNPALETSKSYKVNGTLLDTSCGDGIVLLDKGIILQIPLYCIKIE